MTVEEIRRILIEDYNYDDRVANNIKGKSALMDELQQARQVSVSLEDAEVNENPDMIEIGPRFGSSEWTDFVMNKLPEEDKVGGAPKVQALFRFLEEYVGKITQSITKDVKFLADGVLVLHEIQLYNKLTGENEVFSRVADASSYNTPAPFNRHLSSTAESKALGRCLRAALRLNVLSAEELIADSSEQQDEINMGEPINSSQLTFIDSLCKNNGRGMNINAVALMKSLFDKPLSKLTREDGISIQDKLSDFQKDIGAIPEEFIGYSEGWQSNLL